MMPQSATQPEKSQQLGDIYVLRMTQAQLQLSKVAGTAVTVQCQ